MIKPYNIGLFVNINSINLEHINYIILQNYSGLFDILPLCRVRIFLAGGECRQKLNTQVKY
jgi:hypothetical protein